MECKEQISLEKQFSKEELIEFLLQQNYTNYAASLSCSDDDGNCGCQD